MKDLMTKELTVTAVVLACHVTKEHAPPLHRDRQNHGLALHEAGIKEYVFSDGRTVRVCGGEMIYLPEGSTYTVHVLEKGPCYAINFKLMQEIRAAPFAFRCKSQSEILAHFQNAERIFRMRKSDFEMRTMAELYHILYTLRRDWRTGYLPERKYELIRPAVEAIHAHFAERTLTVAELSALCGITPEYFRRIFSLRFGVSPCEYMAQLRIARSKELLASGLYRVGEVAALLGYGDISHFSREFKKNVGIPPSEYQ